MTMTREDLPELIFDTFGRLRQSGFNLGVDELLAGLTLVSDAASPLAPLSEEAPDMDGLKQALVLIWCSSQSERVQFDPLWQKGLEEMATSSSAVIFEDDDSEPAPAAPVEQPQASIPKQDTPQSVTQTEESAAIDTAAQPVRAPFTLTESAQSVDLQGYLPVSRRSMSYGWRYLRRTVAEGPADILDVAATVQRAAQQGFYLEPVMRRRGYNRAQLVLFIDQNGSMMPLHSLTREVVDTALYESGLPEEQVTVCYFQNVPADYVYTDAFMTQPVDLATVLATCDANTSVLVVSDCGASRGYRRLERIRATTRFLRQLRQRTQLCAWLNPVPVERWSGSSAEIVANLVRMFQMDDDGLSNAIDVIRGLQPQVL